MSVRKLLFALLLTPLFCFGTADKSPADTLLEAARNGDVPSQLKVADQFFFGKNNRKVNPALAAYWFRKAADAGSPRGQFNYGICCLKGWGVPASSQTGFLWISKAAEQQLEEALIMQAELLFRGLPEEDDPARSFPAMSADPEKSLAILRKLFSSGSSSAAKSLAGLLLSDQKLRSQNAAELRKCSEFAVRKMPLDIESVLMYSTVLQNGIGGNSDEKKAVELLHSISDFSPEAMARLSVIYEYGFSVPQDRKKALELCRKAAKLGSPRAMFTLGTKYLEGDMVEHSLSKAVDFFKQSWSGGYPPAAAALGKCFANGMGVDKNPEKAFDFFMQGAVAGDPEAQYHLGVCFSKAIGTAKNSAGAVHWFKAASESGHPDAMRELGISLIEGKGVKTDRSEGLRLLDAAASKGDVQAIEYLNGAKNI